jgi:hypothetical protein
MRTFAEQWSANMFRAVRGAHPVPCARMQPTRSLAISDRLDCVVLTIEAAGLGIFAKRVFQQQARLVKPARGGGHHQEMADPAKYGSFRIPHVSDTHKRLAHVRNLLFLILGYATMNARTPHTNLNATT